MKTKAHKSSFWLIVILLMTVPLTAACERQISRNDDGSLTVETSITQEELQSAIQEAIADPLITEMSVTLQTGDILVNGQRQWLNDPSKSDTLTFRLNLGVSAGHLTASVSDAQIDGVPVDQERVTHWNETIANHLENIANRRPNAVLQSVSVTSEAATMTWQVTK
ncbi:MAG: hypothetical protein AB1649_16215 [Chloroflexota bacterium]